MKWQTSSMRSRLSSGFPCPGSARVSRAGEGILPSRTFAFIRQAATARTWLEKSKVH